MDLSVMTSQLAQSIDNLFHGRAVSESNLFIHEFTERKECWMSALRLLKSDGAHIRYFCANILYNKVRKNWNQLENNERQEVLAVLTRYILLPDVVAAESEQNKALRDRVILALCGVCIRIPQGLGTYFNAAMQFVQPHSLASSASSDSTRNTYGGDGFDPPSTKSILTGLHMFTIVPEEIDGADISRPLRVELGAQLSQAAAQCWVVIDGFSERIIQAQQTTAETHALIIALLAFTKAWLSCGCTLTGLYKDHLPTFRLLCASLQVGLSKDVMMAGCACLKELVVLKEYPRPLERDGCLEIILSSLLAQSQQLLTAIYTPSTAGTATTPPQIPQAPQVAVCPANTATGTATGIVFNVVDYSKCEMKQCRVDEDEDMGQMMVELCNTLVCLGENEILLFTTGYSSENVQTSVQRCDSLVFGFFHTLIAIMRIKPRKMAFSSFDYWNEMVDIPSAAWHPILLPDVLPRVLNILINHCVDPSQAHAILPYMLEEEENRDSVYATAGLVTGGVPQNDENNNNEEDREDFETFRDTRLGISELHCLLVEHLQSNYFGPLQKRFQAFAIDPSAIQSSWGYLEVTLYTLCCVMDPVKELIKPAPAASGGGESSASSTYRQSIVQFLYTIAQCCLNVSDAPRYPALHQACCKYFGSLTFLLAPKLLSSAYLVVFTADGQQGRICDLYFAVLRYLVESVGSCQLKATSKDAAKAVHKLSIHGIKRLSAFVPEVLQQQQQQQQQQLELLIPQDASSLLTNEQVMSGGNEGWQTLIYLVVQVSRYIQHTPRTVDNSALLTLIESVVRCIMEIAPTSAGTRGISASFTVTTMLKARLLVCLGDSIVKALSHELDAAPVPVSTATSITVPTDLQADGGDGNFLNLARIELLLSCASQLIRFSDVAVDSSTAVSEQHVLVPFLGIFWPHLQRVAADARTSSESVVINAIFGIFSKVLMSAGSAAMSEIPNIVSAIVSAVAARSTSAGAALQCASVLIESIVQFQKKKQTEALASQMGMTNANGGDMLQQQRGSVLELILTITDGYCLDARYDQLVQLPATPGTSSSCMQLFGTNFEAMGNYFSLIHTYIVLCRYDFAITSQGKGHNLPLKVLQLCVVCLLHCSEKEALRPLLQVVQKIYLSSHVVSSMEGMEQQQRQEQQVEQQKQLQIQCILTGAGLSVGAQIVKLLIKHISSGSIAPALVVNITDTLHCILLGCEDSSTNILAAANASVLSNGSNTSCIMTPGMGSPIPNGASFNTSALWLQCQQWFHEAIFSTECLLPLTTVEHRQLCLHLLLTFATTRNRRFKTLLQDIYKICSSELTVDTLLAYSDAIL